MLSSAFPLLGTSWASSFLNSCWFSEGLLSFLELHIFSMDSILTLILSF